MKHLRDFSRFFAMQFATYGVFTWNFRAIANGLIFNTVMSDLTAALLSFVVIREVAKAEGSAKILGYVLGGACGSVASILITRWLGVGR